MLADAEDDGVVRCQACALRLHNVEILTLSVRSWMACEEGVRWVLTCVGQGKSQGQSVWVRFDGVL